MSQNKIIMQQLTNKEIAKVFALYYKSCEVKSSYLTFENNSETLRQVSAGNDEYKLMLTPLEQISDVYVITVVNDTVCYRHLHTRIYDTTTRADFRAQYDRLTLPGTACILQRRN